MHKRVQEGSKGHGKTTGRAYKLCLLFFFLFFRVYWHSPPLLAPLSPPPNHEEHTYKGVFFMFGKFSTPHHHETRKMCPMRVFRVLVPSPSNHTHKTHPYVACFVCVLICYSQPLNMTNAPFWAHFLGLAPTPSPSTFKQWKCACFGPFLCLTNSTSLSLYDIPLPSPFTPPLPFLALPFSFFFFLGTFLSSKLLNLVYMYIY